MAGEAATGRIVTLAERKAAKVARLSAAVEELCRVLAERGAEPVAMRSYERFKAPRAAPAVEAAGVIVAGLAAEIAAFRAAIDPG